VGGAEKKDVFLLARKDLQHSRATGKENLLSETFEK
jgi:hypothetical protein